MTRLLFILLLTLFGWPSFGPAFAQATAGGQTVSNGVAMAWNSSGTNFQYPVFIRTNSGSYQRSLTYTTTNGWLAGSREAIADVNADNGITAGNLNSSEPDFTSLIEGNNIIFRTDTASFESAFYLTPRTGGNPINPTYGGNFVIIMQVWK